MQVAIVGAGIAGATCASELAAAGHRVTVFDKGRSVGGRLASKIGDGFCFDFGAQYFTASCAELEQSVIEWSAKGWVQVWDARFGAIECGAFKERPGHKLKYVGLPTMQSIVGRLLDNCNVYKSHTVKALSRNEQSNCWTISGISHSSDFDTETEKIFEDTFEFLIVALPAIQANILVPNARVAELRMDPCWAVMVEFDKSLETDFDGARVTDHALSWVARDSTKPGRPVGERWVLHASAGWSRDNIEIAADSAAEALLQEFFRLLSIDPIKPSFSKAHRWRYARAVNPMGQQYLLDKEAKLAYCGDWCSGDRFENAFLSGLSLGKYLASLAL